MTRPDTRSFERMTRDYALHLALWVRREGSRLVLRKRVSIGARVRPFPGHA